jgi:type VI secretion system protein VasJ
MDLLQLGKEPISQDQPAGFDVRYDPGFDELQSEIDKLSHPSLTSAVEWEKVIRLSSDILANKSKDLTAASYLAVALIHKQQLDGLAQGLQIYLDLLNNFWDDLFPPKARMRGRVRAVEWWIEKTESALRQIKETALRADNLVLITESLHKIEEFLGRNMEDSPGFGSLFEFLHSIEIPSEDKQAEAGSQETPQTVITPTVPGKVPETEKIEVSAEITTPKEAQRVLDEGLQKIHRAAAFLCQQDPTYPLSYRLGRIAAWSSIEELPPSVDGKTRIPAPPVQIKTFLNDLKNKSDYEGLLRSAEERLSQFIFWIDLNRLVSDALSQLGSRYQKAQETVCEETGLFIRYFPGIEEFAFSDGTPFADSETKQWIKNIIRERASYSQQSVSIPETSTETGDKNIMQKDREETQELIKKGKLNEAVELFEQGLRNLFSKRDKMLWRITFSQLLVNKNQIKYALPLIDQILKDIDLYALEEYDPAVALKGLTLAWISFHSQSDQMSRERATGILHRIAKIDMREMIRLGKT